MNEEIIKKAAPFMMEAHHKAWLLVMEPEKFNEQEINTIVDSLFIHAIKFSTTIDDNRVSATSSKTAGEVTALRTLVDYVHEAEKQGQQYTLECFYRSIVPAVKANTQFKDSIIDLVDHFSKTEDMVENSDYIHDLSVLRKMLGES